MSLLERDTETMIAKKTVLKIVDANPDNHAKVLVNTIPIHINKIIMMLF